MLLKYMVVELTVLMLRPKPDRGSMRMLCGVKRSDNNGRMSDGAKRSS